MHQERSRLDTKFREELRNVDPKNAVMMHIKDMWRTQPTPNLDDLETIGSVVSNIYSDDDDYLIVVPDGYVLVGKSASVTYGEFDGYSSGNKTRKQIIDGLARVEDYTIYKITQQYEENNIRKHVVTFMDIDSIDVIHRKIISKGYEFDMKDIELDRANNKFIVKELLFDGMQYYTPSGTIVKNIIPRKVTMINEPNRGVSGLDTESVSEDIEPERQATDQESTE